MNHQTTHHPKTTSETMTFTGIEYDTAGEAVQGLDASGEDVAFSIGGRYFSTRRGEFDRIELAGCQPTTWHDFHGRLMSVPGRD